jgi:DNA-binding HxlR family transcriptional regulator
MNHVLQECGLRELYKFLGEKWTIYLFSNLSKNPISYNQLNRLSHNSINPTLLSTRLKEFIRLKVVDKKIVKGKWRYIITPNGEELKITMMHMNAWAINDNINPPVICKADGCICSTVISF